MVSSGIEQPAHVTLNIRIVRLLATVLVRNVVWEGMQHAAAARCVPRCCADRRPDPHHRRAAGSPMPNANATTGTFAAEKEQFAQADRRSKEQGHLALPLKVSPTARRSEQHRAAISRRRSISHRDRKQPRVAPDMAQTQQPSRTTPSGGATSRSRRATTRCPRTSSARSAWRLARSSAAWASRRPPEQARPLASPARPRAPKAGDQRGLTVGGLEVAGRHPPVALPPERARPASDRATSLRFVKWRHDTPPADDGVRRSTGATGSTSTARTPGPR